MRRFTCYSEATPQQLKLARAESDLAEQQLFARMNREMTVVSGPGPDNGFESVPGESNVDRFSRAIAHGVSYESATIPRPEPAE